VTDRGFDNGRRFRKAQIVPVYIIDDTSLCQLETAFAPEGERCVLVSGHKLERQLAAVQLLRAIAAMILLLTGVYPASGAFT
jgi:hypothetical protein